MVQLAVAALHEHVETPGRPGDRRRLAHIGAAEVFPFVPDLAVPPDVVQRAVVEDREHVNAVRAPTDRRWWRGQVAAVVLEIRPGAPVGRLTTPQREVVAAGKKIEARSADDKTGRAGKGAAETHPVRRPFAA